MLFTFAVALAAVTLVWIVSLPLRDVGIVDIYWGPGFVLVTAATILWVHALDLRGVLLFLLVAVWAFRLATHLFLRWRRANHEDHRYAAMRNKAGSRFPVQSLFTVFWLQGVIMWFVSLPIQSALMAPHAPLGFLDLAGACVAIAGILIEGIADHQLTQFGRDPANRGHVLDMGLWAWSRHPNYFGDAAMWWGIFLVCWAGGCTRWAILGPMLMTYLLLRVSGVTLLERKMVDRRPAYADYIRRTSAFIPLPPKKR
jgi:steroid 5-alpha reductase family enzyme